MSKPKKNSASGNHHIPSITSIPQDPQTDGRLANSASSCPQIFPTSTDLQAGPYKPQTLHGVQFDSLMASFHAQPLTGELLERRRAAFESRLAELTAMRQQFEDQKSSALAYKKNLGLLAQHLEIIVATLQGTLDGENPDLWPDQTARRLLLQKCQVLFENLVLAVAILGAEVVLPIDPNELRAAARTLEELLSDENAGCDRAVTERHWMEVEFADGGLDRLRELIVTIEAIHQIRTAEDQGLPALTSQPEALTMQPVVSEDFCSLTIGEQRYIFSPTQAAVVRILWNAWVARTPAVFGESILEGSGSQGARVRDIFKISGKEMHPAWGKLIVKDGRNRYFLNFPEKSRSPT